MCVCGLLLRKMWQRAAWRVQLETRKLPCALHFTLWVKIGRAEERFMLGRPRPALPAHARPRVRRGAGIIPCRSCAALVTSASGGLPFYGALSAACCSSYRGHGRGLQSPSCAIRGPRAETVARRTHSLSPRRHHCHPTRGNIIMMVELVRQRDSAFNTRCERCGTWQHRSCDGGNSGGQARRPCRLPRRRHGGLRQFCTSL